MVAIRVQRVLGLGLGLVEASEAVFFESPRVFLLLGIPGESSEQQQLQLQLLLHFTFSLSLHLVPLVSVFFRQEVLWFPAKEPTWQKILIQFRDQSF